MGNIKQTRITLRKGLKSDLPSHAPLGEPLYCIDTEELYIGNGVNKEVKKLTDANITEKLNKTQSILFNITTPETFGAKGDGDTDDTIAIQQAIDSCSGGGKVQLSKTYKITQTLILKSGVTIMGFSDGCYTTNSKILCDLTNNTPAIKFDNITTGITIQNLYIKPFNANSNHKFIGIEFNGGEYTNVKDVFIEYANVGYLFSATDRANYLLSLDGVSARNCDIGIKFIKSPKKWSNGISLKLKELSYNRVGLQAHHGNGNTIIGTSTEIGNNTEMGINICEGFWCVQGSLWLEGSPRGIVVEGGVLSLSGEIYNIKSIENIGGRIIQNSNLLFTNYTPRKLCYHNLKFWLSFDNFETTNVLNYATGNSISNAPNRPVVDGIYGHSCTTIDSFLKSEFQDNFDASKDWTLIVLMKSNLSPGEEVVLFNIGTDTGNTPYYIKFQNFKGETHLRVVSDAKDTLPNGNFNLGLEKNITDTFGWVIISYDSEHQKLTSYNSSGIPVVSNPEGLVNIQRATQGKNTFINTKTKILMDEFVLFNRKLHQEEILSLTHLDMTPPSYLQSKLLNKKVDEILSSK